jgi:hypothetical protein
LVYPLIMKLSIFYKPSKTLRLYLDSWSCSNPPPVVALPCNILSVRSIHLLSSIQILPPPPEPCPIRRDVPSPHPPSHAGSRTPSSSHPPPPPSRSPPSNHRPPDAALAVPSSYSEPAASRLLGSKRSVTKIEIQIRTRTGVKQ